MHARDVDKATPYFIHQGSIPENLYRYRSLTSRDQYRNVLSEILNEQVYLASMKSLNDPDEGRLRIEFKKDISAIYSYFYSSEIERLGHARASRLAADRVAELVSTGYRLPEGVARIMRAEFGRRIRVACFTTLPTNFLMWENSLARALSTRRRATESPPPETAAMAEAPRGSHSSRRRSAASRRTSGSTRRSPRSVCTGVDSPQGRSVCSRGFRGFARDDPLGSPARSRPGREARPTAHDEGALTWPRGLGI